MTIVLSHVLPSSIHVKPSAGSKENRNFDDNPEEENGQKTVPELSPHRRLSILSKKAIPSNGMEDPGTEFVHEIGSEPEKKDSANSGDGDGIGFTVKVPR